MRVFCLPVILTVFVLLSQSQAAILPFTACTACATIFKQLGCLETESVICKFLAIKFTTDFSGQQLCDNFICEGGYGQVPDGHQCKTIATCLITKWRAKGMCPGTNICCAP